MRIYVIVAALSLIFPLCASATLIMEPVFLRTEGSGPSEAPPVVGIYAPDFINPGTGEPFLIADEPGEIDIYPAGYPADQGLVDVIRFYNNTEYELTGFQLTIVGTADEPEPFNFTVDRDPNVDAFWGDANNDGQIGLSDIFAVTEVSEDGRTITFSDGSIPVNGRFTDYLYSTTTDQQPFLAAVEATFSGVRSVPEPGTLGLLSGAFALLMLRRRARTTSPAGLK